MRPALSYTIWFSQRTGSTLLCSALEGTGVAGRPGEYLTEPTPADIFKRHGVDTPVALRSRIWEAATTSNGVLGLKHSITLSRFAGVIDMLGEIAGHDTTRPGIWENAFPDGRHIFMTRRNKVRLAVSWWKAIQSQEWHRLHGTPPKGGEIADRYAAEPIDHLMAECVLREAATQEFFDEGRILPLTIVYEDFVSDYEGTVRGILHWLGLPAPPSGIAPPAYDRLSDAVSEEWVSRFRRDKQAGWQKKAW